MAHREDDDRRCELCREEGAEENPLTIYHVDGNRRNNGSLNKLIVHRVVCRTFASFVTQARLKVGAEITREDILNAWQDVRWHTDILPWRKRVRIRGSQ